MPRNPRCVDPGVAYHITQRGVDRAKVFDSERDRHTYLSLVESNLADAAVKVLAYCLMSNHVHWVLVPDRGDSLSVLFRRVHGRYAQYFNVIHQRTGHLWQNRFFGCAVASKHLSTVLRYVEQNPVRAGLVPAASDYRWSSARPHLAGPESAPNPLLDWHFWRESGGSDHWNQLLDSEDDDTTIWGLRRSTFAGRPFGDPDFLQQMESKFGRHWSSRDPYRKPPAVEAISGTERSGPARRLRTSATSG
jgi:putative transposase